jgi:exodeoxyribonuclease I
VSKSPTFYWHDYETFGTQPQKDWPSQFAGVRTDAELNIISEPLVIYCQPPADCLPQPEACLITGIAPQLAQERGLKEKDFIAKIHQQMAEPNTCSAGFNSIRFDDEVTRNALYRNFYDPYQREYMNGNSRWDIIDLLRMCYALRPEGIEWPQTEEGQVSFKLELLTKANGIGHQSAHDALSDVLATIEMAKLIKNKQGKLFEYYLAFRKKEKVAELLNIHNPQALLHVSSKYPASQHRLAVVLPVLKEPANNNATVVFDLSKDPALLLEQDAETLRKLLYTKSEDLGEDQQRTPLKSVHANKCPALAPLTTARPHDIERLQVDIARCLKHQEILLKHFSDIQKKLTEVYSANDFPEQTDPDLMIYSGGFFSREDKNKMAALINYDAAQLQKAQDNLNFSDKRISEMLFRYRARNFPESLRADEQQRWKDFCKRKLNGEEAGSSLSLNEFDTRISKLEQEHAQAPEKLKMLETLKDYRNELLKKLA